MISLHMSVKQVLSLNGDRLINGLDISLETRAIELFFPCTLFFIRISKILVRLNVHIPRKFSASKYSSFVLTFFDTFLPVNNENYF